MVFMRFKLLQSCPTFCDPMTVACKSPLSTGFSEKEYWSGLPCPPTGDLTDPGFKPTALALQEDSLPLSRRGSLLKWH